MNALKVLKMLKDMKRDTPHSDRFGCGWNEAINSVQRMIAKEYYKDLEVTHSSSHGKEFK